MPTKEDLKYFQSLPLEIKVAMTKTRIREWVNYYGENETYISFSGGKDSTVLLSLVRELYPNIKAVFVNTGLEYPEIQAFAKSIPNVTVLTPTIPFNKVLEVKGYPVISKNIAHNISIARRNPNGNVANNIVFTENKSSRFSAYKYKELVNADFLISDQCCNITKKEPLKNYEKAFESNPFIATLASESKMRETQWLHNSCNAFDCKRPTSQPMSFWTEQDVLEYIYKNNIKIASVYGSIKSDNEQLYLCDNGIKCKYKTTGCNRTGCIFCGFGTHLEPKGEGRFIRLKETHPKQYNYCINGGEYDINGLWKPNNKGLGMGHVFEELNKLYSKNNKPFIEF